MLRIETLTFNVFGVNTYVVWNPDTLKATIIDPGMATPREESALDELLGRHGLTVEQVINTHMHLDHILGDNYVRQRYGAPVAASEADAFLSDRAAMQARMFSLPLNPDAVAIDINLTDGQEIDVCGSKVKILSVPGHSPGSIVLYFPSEGWAITGDVIFQGSIGRTDLVGGNYNQLIEGISLKLMTLPDNTVIFPGHGSPTSIGAERRSNPFIR